MILVEILCPVAGYARTATVLRHQPAVGQVDGLQLAVAVFNAVVVKNCSELAVLFPIMPCGLNTVSSGLDRGNFEYNHGVEHAKETSNNK